MTSFTRHVDIATQIRRQIAVGKLKPGDRLPRQVDLIKQYGSSSVTVQRAIDSLSRDGFVEARGRSGTYVTPAPPCLVRYALAVPGRNPDQRQFGWYAALKFAATLIAEEKNVQIPMFFDLEQLDHSRDYEELTSLAQGDLLAGIMFAGLQSNLYDTWLVRESPVPKINLGGEIDEGGIHMPAVRVSSDSMLEQMVRKTVSENRRRAAILCHPFVRATQYDSIIRQLHEHNVETRPEWSLAVSPSESVWAYNAARAILSAPAEQRPDALLILDDNLVEDAAAGIASLGLRCPAELLVLAHCNSPYMPSASVPVHYIGFDVNDVVRRCVDMLGEMRLGKAIESIHIPAGPHAPRPIRAMKD